LRQGLVDVLDQLDEVGLGQDEVGRYLVHLHRDGVRSASRVRCLTLSTIGRSLEAANMVRATRWQINAAAYILGLAHHHFGEHEKLRNVVMTSSSGLTTAHRLRMRS
jgi:hypothetical protein